MSNRSAKDKARTNSLGKEHHRSRFGSAGDIALLGMVFVLIIGILTFVNMASRRRSTVPKDSAESTKHDLLSATNSLAISQSESKPSADFERDRQKDVDHQKWEAALEAAKSMTTTAPYELSGWIMEAYALHELKRTDEAFEVLSGVVDRFPNDYLPVYNLACYACKLEKLDDARRWLKKAMEIGGTNAVREIALSDPDLDLLSAEIKAW